MYTLHYKAPISFNVHMYTLNSKPSKHLQCTHVHIEKQAKHANSQKLKTPEHKQKQRATKKYSTHVYICDREGSEMLNVHMYTFAIREGFFFNVYM